MDVARMSVYADGIIGLLRRTAGVVDEHGNHHSPADGKFVSKGAALIGAVREALKPFAGEKDDQGVTSAAYFADREGAETNRFWEVDHDSDDTFTIHMVHDETANTALDGNDEEYPDGVTLELSLDEMIRLGDEITLTLLKRDPPPFDPDDRRSVLIASMLAQPRGGLNLTDDRLVDFSSADLEITNDSGETEMFKLSDQELSQLHATVMSALFKHREATSSA